MKLIFFFFQAEDGIRDVAVTGVQTCALPIYLSGSKASSRQGRKSILGEVWTLGQLVRVQAGRRHAGFQRFTAKSRHLLQEGFGKIRDGTGLWCLLFRSRGQKREPILEPAQLRNG